MVNTIFRVSLTLTSNWRTDDRPTKGNGLYVEDKHTQKSSVVRKTCGMRMRPSAGRLGDKCYPVILKWVQCTKLPASTSSLCPTSIRPHGCVSRHAHVLNRNNKFIANVGRTVAISRLWISM